jgi:hypothetical protein
MGCQFNCVIVPEKIQKVRELKKYYEDYKNNLMENCGEDFEGYSGDMCVDDGLVIKKNLKLEINNKKEIEQKDLEEYYDQLLDLCTDHCEKWGASIAVRLGNQWAICGAYSD